MTILFLITLPRGDYNVFLLDSQGVAIMFLLHFNGVTIPFLIILPRGDYNVLLHFQGVTIMCLITLPRGDYNVSYYTSEG